MRERRRARRVPARWEVAVTDGMGRRWGGTAIDVSTLGARVELTQPLSPHRFLLASFTPPDGKGPVWVDFAIVWNRGNGMCGVQFLNLPPGVSQRLTAVLESQMEAGRSGPRRSPAAKRGRPRRPTPRDENGSTPVHRGAGPG